VEQVGENASGVGAEPLIDHRATLGVVHPFPLAIDLAIDANRHQVGVRMWL
jgi:hypothetical protein